MVRFSAPDYTPGVEFRVFVAAVRDEVAAKISIQLRARAGTPGAPETLTFSYTVGGEQDAPVDELAITQCSPSIYSRMVGIDIPRSFKSAHLIS
jgi:hypothetical protein